MLSKRRLLAMTALVSASMAATAAFAQANTSAGSNEIEELVVTAEKREQSLQDVPVAVTAFTDERRETVGINSVQDLTNFTPGLAYSTNNDRINMRGIGRFTNNRSSEGGVAMYSDSVYTSSVTAFARSSLFIDRTEVLRGPQGTLYGRNSIGGALNIISKRPTDDFYAEVRAGFANYDRQYYEAAISGPIAGTVRGRLAGSWDTQEEGYFRNLSGGPDEGGHGQQWQIEAQLDGSLADEKLEWWFKFDTAEWDNIGRGPGGRSTTVFGPRDTFRFFTGTSPGLTPNPQFGSTVGRPSTRCGDDVLCFDTDDPNYITLENHGAAFHVTLHLDTFDIRYVGGHVYYDYRLQTDVDDSSRRDPFTVTNTTPQFLIPTATNPNGFATFLPAGPIQFFPRQNNQYQEEVWWFSNEINIASTTDSPIQWLLGFYQFREGSNYKATDARFPDDPRFASPLTLAGTPAAPNPERRYAIGYSQNSNESYATFGQVDWQMTDVWKFTAGLRYTLDRKKTDESARLFSFLSPAFAAASPVARLPVVIDVTDFVVAPATQAQVDPSVISPVWTDPTTGMRHRLLKNEWSGITGTLGVDWKPTEDLMAYGKYTRGYKAGGFNAGTTTLQQRVTTQEEKIDAYEVGVKATLLDRRLQANASAFYYKYGDIQVPLTGLNPILQTNVTEFFNLPEAIVKGFELETTWQPIDNLQILANYSYLDARVEEACCFRDPDDPNAIQPGADVPFGAGTGNTVGQTTNLNQDLSGERLPSSTPHRVTVNVNYTLEFDPGKLTASLTYVWRDETYYSIFNRWYNKAKAYEQVDARALFNDADDRFTVIAFVKNIFDTRGSAGVGGGRINSPGLAGFTGQNTYSISYVPPRTYGVEFQYRF